MINKTCFGAMPDGTDIDAYCLVNQNNVSVNILSLGAIIQSWKIGSLPEVDIVLGFDTVEEYLTDGNYVGTVVGRYANRIAQGRFSLGQGTFELASNQGPHCLHGGIDGFHHRVWRVTQVQEGDKPSITLALISEDGDQGFPGQLEARVTYQLTQDDTLRITYEATSDSDTVFNPTQHSYFNLGGHDNGETRHNLVQVCAEHYTPADQDSIPTGEIRAVDNTVFDLTEPKELAALMAQQDPQVVATNGLDHNWCLDGFEKDQSKNRKVATLIDPVSKRTLEVSSTMPGIQVYNANFLGEGTRGKGGAQYGPYHAVCLETQFYPDTPNKPEFPNAVLKKGQTFISRTDYQLILE